MIAGPVDQNPQHRRAPGYALPGLYAAPVPNTLNDLMKMSDADLVALYDDVAKNTQVGLQFYLDELVRRSTERSSAAMENLTKTAAQLATVSAVVSIAALIVAIVTLVVAAGLS